MDAQSIFELVVRASGEGVFGFHPAVTGPAADPKEAVFRDAGFRVRPDSLAAVMAHLRDEPALRFGFLQNLTAVDWPKRAVFEVVYHLYSYVHRHAICVRVDVPRAAPHVPTVALIWKTANWMEREQYDLLGVIFDGHPDLRRLLMPDDWVGHPMRKDYSEGKSYRGMPTSRPSPIDLLLDYDRAHVAKPTSVAKTAVSDDVAKAPSGEGAK